MNSIAPITHITSRWPLRAAQVLRGGLYRSNLLLKVKIASGENQERPRNDIMSSESDMNARFFSDNPDKNILQQ
jgi:hypothetical protein